MMIITFWRKKNPTPNDPHPRQALRSALRLLLGRLGSHLLQRLGAFARGLLQGLVGLLGHAARLGVRDLLRCVLYQGLQLGHQGKHLRLGWRMGWWRWNQGFFKKCYLHLLTNWCSDTHGCGRGVCNGMECNAVQCNAMVCWVMSCHVMLCYLRMYVENINIELEKESGGWGWWEG